MTRNKTAIFKILLYGCLLWSLFSCGVSRSLKDRPDTANYPGIPERIQTGQDQYVVGNDFIQKNHTGQWEMRVSGNPLQLGLATGSLTQELFAKQEDIFLSKVKTLVPSKLKRKLLTLFLAWYNRKMHLHIPEAYKTEILGLSKFASSAYNELAPPYLRILYLHGAHDIGHALQDLALVGCSSFAAWGPKTNDGNLIIGRNFDFYAGDDFAQEKIIAFVAPESGHRFMSVTWPGMIGVVSGMNEKGLTVTINAGKSSIPLVAKTPISLVTREILQFASNIEEAIVIAKKREVFVSESILVGSAADNKAVIIEKSPKKFGVYESPNEGKLICTNHFQSEVYANDERNLTHKENSHSLYRYEKLETLFSENHKISLKMAVNILRNTKGLNDKAIGFGNEKALNQLLAHHGIVFKPSAGMVWVSSNPYNLGEFTAYKLDEVFEASPGSTLFNSLLNIEKDPFLFSEQYADYESYRSLRKELNKAINNKQHFRTDALYELQRLNPEYWESYYLVGKYYYERQYYLAALLAFEKSRSKELPKKQVAEELDRYIRKLRRKTNQ